MARSTGNWSDLPIDLVSLVAEKLHVFDDILSFRSVCTTWRSASTTESINAANRFPWMLQTKEAQGVVTKKYMFDLEHKKHYESTKFSREFKTLCLGWKGWVLAVKRRGTMCLLHAFKSSKSLSLPDKKSLQERRYDRITVCKAVLSADPFTNQSDYILVIIYDGGKGDGKLAFWRPGDKIYTKVNVQSSRVYDVAFHGSQLYAVTWDSVMVFDVAGFNLAFTYQLEGKVPDHGTSVYWHWQVKDYYLVELDSELVLLMRSRNSWLGEINNAMKFNLFSVSGGWKEIKDLGNKAIFIGTNQSFALDDASKIPECRPNHIYFAALPSGGCGVYNLTNAKVVEWFDCNPSKYWYSCPGSSLWVQPSFD